MKNIISSFATFLALLGLSNNVTAQELPLILDKAGNFEMLSRTDYALPECGFSKDEMTANLQRISELVVVVRKNKVLNGLEGFDGRARIYNTINCKGPGSYPVPSRISFEFAAWYKKKDGTPARGLIEPPEWSLYVNKMVPEGSFSSDGFSPKMGFFTVPEKHVTIEPGIDVYDGENYVIYNPNQPDYWLPVTVKEAFDVVFAENKAIKDQIQRDFALKYLNEEWASIPESDWDKPATQSGMLSRVGTKPGFPKIMKVNPVYWDKSKPKSEIQLIYFKMMGNRKYLEQRSSEYLKANSISYHEARFEESLDMNFVRSLTPLVVK